MPPYCHLFCCLRKVCLGAVPTPGCLLVISESIFNTNEINGLYDEEAILQPFPIVSHQLWVDECVKAQNTDCGASLCLHVWAQGCGWMRLRSRFRVSADTSVVRFSAAFKSFSQRWYTRLYNLICATSKQ